jgi:hypothetical protein
MVSIYCQGNATIIDLFNKKNTPRNLEIHRKKGGQDDPLMIYINRHSLGYWLSLDRV